MTDELELEVRRDPAGAAAEIRALRHRLHRHDQAAELWQFEREEPKYAWPDDPTMDDIETLITNNEHPWDSSRQVLHATELIRALTTWAAAEGPFGGARSHDKTLLAACQDAEIV